MKILIICLILVWILCPALGLAQDSKKIIASSADLPKLVYAVPENLSDLLKSDAVYKPFAMTVRADLETLLRDYDVRDNTLRRRFEMILTYLDMQDGNPATAKERIKRIRTLETPANILDNGNLFVLEAMIKASELSGEQSGVRFQDAFRQIFKQAVNDLPVSLSAKVIGEKAYFGDLDEDFLISDLTRSLAPVVEENAGKITLKETLHVTANRLERQFFIRLKDDIKEIYADYLGTHPPVSIWTNRAVVLTGNQKLKPVVIGIWDNGVDVSVFPKNLFVNKREKLNGRDDDGNGFIDDVNGIGFYIEARPTAELLFPVKTEDSKEFPELLRDRRAQADIAEGIESDSTRTYKLKMKAQKPEEAARYESLQQLLGGEYSHGTGVAGLAVEGNPAARILVVRETYKDASGETLVMTMENALRIADNYRKIVAYLKTRKVRVVNMSWVYNSRGVELNLEDNNIGANAAERKKLAADHFSILKTALYEAIKSAPEILFICGAGNEASDAVANETIPASFDLPNLLTVGAVDAAGEAWAYSNYGKTVRLYANGVNIERLVPGGGRMKSSGTSLAAPQVSNLAAKLFALNPKLTVAQVAALILNGTEPNDADARMMLINPKRSVDLELKR